MLTHVVTEVFQQCYFLRQEVRKYVHGVKVFGSITLDVLNVSISKQQPQAIHCSVLLAMYMVSGKKLPRQRRTR